MKFDDIAKVRGDPVMTCVGRLVSLTNMCLFVILLQACSKPSPPTILEATQVLEKFRADSTENLLDATKELFGVKTFGVTQDVVCTKVSVIDMKITEIRKIIGDEYTAFPGNAKHLVTMSEEGICYPLDQSEMEKIKKVAGRIFTGKENDFAALL